MWRKGQHVSNGLREFAERGEAWALMREVEAAGERLQSVHAVFSAPAVPSGTGQSTAELEVHSRHSLVSLARGLGGGRGAPGVPRASPRANRSQVSFVVRIVPSPDWFVGVDSLDLCEGSRWREQVAVDLYPYDAGTDSGFTFSSPNFATIPQDAVTEASDRARPCALFPGSPAQGQGWAVFRPRPSGRTGWHKPASRPPPTRCCLPRSRPPRPATRPTPSTTRG